MAKTRGLGRGLGALIPTKPTSSQRTTSSSLKTSSKKIASSTPEESIMRVLVDQIQPNPHQPREHFAHKDLDELISSIKKHGVLQPLIISMRDDGGYELVAGERRLRAARMAGLKDVPVVLRSLKDQDKLVLALIENIQRADLNPIEEARAYQKLIDEYDMTQEAVAGQLGKSRSQVANTLRLLDLPEKIQKAVREGRVPVSAARALVTIADPKDQMRWLKRMLTEHVTVRDVEQGVRKAKGVLSKKDVNLLAAEEDLRKILGTKVTIQKRGESGHIRVAFYSEEELSELLRRFSKG